MGAKFSLENNAKNAIYLSPNYGVIHLVYTVASILVLVWTYQFKVFIQDPVAEILRNATNSYSVECYAFAARSVGYHDNTMCTSYAFGSACWDVFRSMQDQQCGEQRGVIFPAVSEELQAYAFQSDVFILIIVLLCVLALVLLAVAYIVPAQRASFMFLVCVCHGIALFFAVALMESLSLCMSHVTYDDNNNKGQRVQLGGTAVVILLPFIELFLDATPRAFVSQTKQE